MEGLDIHISKRVRRIALYTLFFVVIMHGCRYCMTMFSHDSLAFAANADRAWQISLGRFMQPVYWKFRGHVGAPYIVGLMSFAWLFLSVLLVSNILKLQSNVSIFLLTGTMTGSIALVSSNATYIYLSDIYLLALFLNVAAVWLCVEKKGWMRLFAPIILAVSAGLYQAYLQVFVVLVMIWAVLEILEKGDVWRIIASCLASMAALLIGIALYLLAFKLVLGVTGIVPEDGYNGMTGIGDYAEYDLAALFRGTLLYPVQYMLRGIGKDSYVVILGRATLLVVALASTGFILLKKRRRWPLTLSVLLILFLLPAGMNCMYFVSKGLIHDLIIYSYCFADVYAVAVSELAWKTAEESGDIQKERKCPAWLVKTAACLLPTILCILLFDKTIYANQLYLKKQLEYDATQTVMTRVLDRIEQTDGYVVGETPVKFIGTLDGSPLAKRRKAFLNSYVVTGAWSNYALTYYGTFWHYFEVILGYPIQPFKGELDASQAKMAEQMPAFPAKGSVEIVDGVLLVKLSEQ
ncbi:MAG: glucosyltransferase domain-containing protein [Clostridiales bacterium]|nr:glucosyltransferase domain-containing protein [Clostridiales bacterium]MDY5513855.1 glucosyltransferase domain-containing protein [Candidatus Ventricola sp.]